MSVTKVIGYCRISTGRQEKGMSLAVQEEEIRRFAAANNLEVIDVRHEVVSGAYPFDRRPVLKKLYDDAENIKGCGVLTSKLDRLSRDVEFIAGLMKKKTIFLSAECGMDSSPILLHVRASVAMEERRKIAERTKAAIRKRMDDGKPVGFDIAANKERNIQKKAVNASREAVKAEAIAFAEWVKEEIIWRKNAGMTMVQIAESLQKRNVPTARGGRWHAKTVYNVMQRWEK